MIANKKNYSEEHSYKDKSQKKLVTLSRIVLADLHDSKGDMHEKY